MTSPSEVSVVFSAPFLVAKVSSRTATTFTEVELRCALDSNEIQSELKISALKGAMKNFSPGQLFEILLIEAEEGGVKPETDNLLAKFKAVQEVLHLCGVKELELLPVWSPDPNHENKRFWDATPSGSLTIVFSSKHPLRSSLELGKEYYLEFVPIRPVDEVLPPESPVEDCGCNTDCNLKTGDALSLEEGVAASETVKQF